MTGSFNLSFHIAFKQCEHLLAGKLGVNGKTTVRELNHGVGAPAAVTRRRLYFEHMRGQKVGQQALQAGLAKRSSQVRQLEKIV